MNRDLTGNEYEDFTYPRCLVMCLALVVLKVGGMIVWMLYRLRALLIWSFGQAHRAVS